MSSESNDIQTMLTSLAIMISITVFLVGLANGPNRSEGNRSPVYFFPAALCSILAISLLLVSGAIPGWWLLSIPLAAVLLWPALMAQICSHNGYYRLSWYIAGLSFSRFKRCRRASQLTLGLQARARLPENQQGKALDWLEQRYRKQLKRLLGGDMIALQLLSFLRNHADDPNWLLQRLRMLREVPEESISAPLSGFAFRLCLPQLLEQDDWSEIEALAQQWDTPARNHAARYVREFIRRQRGESKLIQPIYAWTRWRAGFQIPVWTIAHYWQRHQQLIQALAQHPQASAGFWLGPASRDATAAAALCAQLSSPEQQQRWLQRAQELGLWQAQEAWQQIQQQLQRLPVLNRFEQTASATHSEAAETDALQHTEALLARVNACSLAAQKRFQDGTYRPGLVDYHDWLNLLDCFDQLKRRPDLHELAFRRNYVLLWDWMADLWNQGEQKPLSYFMARVLRPLALRYEYEAMARVCGQIIQLPKSTTDEAA